MASIASASITALLQRWQSSLYEFGAVFSGMEASQQTDWIMTEASEAAKSPPNIEVD